MAILWRNFNVAFCHQALYFPIFTAVCQVIIQIFDKLLFAAVGGMSGSLVGYFPLTEAKVRFLADGDAH